MMSLLSLVAFLSVTATAEAPAMPGPADILLDLAARDAPAGLRFCAERPLPPVRHHETPYDDIDPTCDIIIRMNFHDALRLPTLRVLGPSMIRALEKSPTLWYQAGPYANRYRKALASEAR